MASLATFFADCSVAVLGDNVLIKCPKICVISKVVLQKLIGWGMLAIASRPPSYLNKPKAPIQMASLFAQGDPAMRPVVLSLYTQLPRFRRNDAETGCWSGSHHDLSVDLGLRSWTRRALPDSPAPHQWLVAGGWNLHKSQRKAKVPVPSRRFIWQHFRLFTNSQARCWETQNALSVRQWKRFIHKLQG